uniref:Uncharacterized protein n=1 Tax=Eutreptiella gymnastica TaxID=73025 RepID=A0A7S4GES1_9EUGL
MDFMASQFGGSTTQVKKARLLAVGHTTRTVLCHVMRGIWPFWCVDEEGNASYCMAISLQTHVKGGANKAHGVKHLQCTNPRSHTCNNQKTPIQNRTLILQLRKRFGVRLQ